MTQELPQSKDPLIDEVRDIRQKLWARFDNDIDKVVEYLRRLQDQHRDRVVNRAGTETNERKSA